MTDEQIVKAMICCTNFPVCDRDNCPYGESTNCATMLGKDVVELINRQKAEIEKLRKRVNFVEQANVQLREELKETTEKFNCQQYVYADLSDIIKEKNAEIEKLQSDNSSMQSTLAKMSMGVEEAKAEAIKEFAKRLKNRTIDSYPSHLLYLSRGLHGVIDNLVKEMVGESNV